MNRILTQSVLTLILASCSGSETYQGKWFAVDTRGNEQEIYFTEEKMTLQRSEGDSSVWTYTQHSISIENGSSKYGIRADNGLTYSILFPTKDKEKEPWPMPMGISSISSGDQNTIPMKMFLA